MVFLRFKIICLHSHGKIKQLDLTNYEIACQGMSTEAALCGYAGPEDSTTRNGTKSRD